MIDGLVNADALPVLERMMQFAGARHRLLAHDIANVDTPGFRPVDLPVEPFRAALAEAAEARREGGGRGKGTGADGGLALDVESPGVRARGGSMEVEPIEIGANVLFHDGNDRDVERLMQSLVENFLTFRAAADLMKNRMETLQTAISERV